MIIFLVVQTLFVFAATATKPELKSSNSNNDKRLFTRKELFRCSYPQLNNKEYKNKKLCSHINIQEFFQITKKHNKTAEKYLQDNLERDLRIFHLNCTEHQSQRQNSLFSNPHVLSYIHIRKNGGTSMLQAFKDYSQRMKQACRMDLFQSDHTSKEESNLNIEVGAIMQSLANHQKNSTSKYNHVVFSFVRDPVTRFLSQVGQMTHDGKTFGCTVRYYKSTAQNVMRCIIHQLKRQGTKLDTHYTPQAINLYLASATSTQNIQFTAYSYENLPIFLHSVLEYNNYNKKLHSVKSAMNNHRFNYTIEELTPEMIQDICTIYEIDVVLLKYLGFSSPYCKS